MNKYLHDFFLNLPQKAIIEDSDLVQITKTLKFWLDSDDFVDKNLYLSELKIKQPIIFDKLNIELKNKKDNVFNVLKKMYLSEQNNEYKTFGKSINCEINKENVLDFLDDDIINHMIGLGGKDYLFDFLVQNEELMNSLEYSQKLNSFFKNATKINFSNYTTSIDKFNKIIKNVLIEDSAIYNIFEIIEINKKEYANNLQHIECLIKNNFNNIKLLLQKDNGFKKLFFKKSSQIIDEKIKDIEWMSKNSSLRFSAFSQENPKEIADFINHHQFFLKLVLESGGGNLEKKIIFKAKNILMNNIENIFSETVNSAWENLSYKDIEGFKKFFFGNDEKKYMLSMFNLFKKQICVDNELDNSFGNKVKNKAHFIFMKVVDDYFNNKDKIGFTKNEKNFANKSIYAFCINNLDDMPHGVDYLKISLKDKVDLFFNNLDMSINKEVTHYLKLITKDKNIEVFLDGLKNKEIDEKIIDFTYDAIKKFKTFGNTYLINDALIENLENKINAIVLDGVLCNAEQKGFKKHNI